MLDSFAAGAAAGLTVDLVMYPLDTIKTRLQTGTTSPNRRLYRGVGAMLTGSVPSAAIFFATFDTLKPSVGVVPAAMIGEAVSCAVRVPVEVVKQRMQAACGGPGSVGMARGVYGREGWRGFYVGFGATLLRDLPFAVIQYPLFHALSSSMSSDTMMSGTMADGVCGAVAGGVAALLTHPMDTIKTHSIVYGSSDSMNLLEAIRQSHKRGLLLRGIRQRVAMFTVGGFLYFGAYGLAMNAVHY